MRNKLWYVYIVRCADSSLYAGITTNPKRRTAQHNKGEGSRYIVKSKRPVKLVFLEKYKNHQDAAKRENIIKNWKRENKIKLIDKQKYKESTL